MVWLLGGYIWLFIHRPFEIWPFLGDLRLERMYIFCVAAVWLFYPGKGWCADRLNKAMLYFTAVILLCWFTSPYPMYVGEKVWEDHYKVGVLFLLLVSVARDEKKLKQLIAMYLIALFLYQAHSFLEFLNGRYSYRMRTYRMVGVDKTGNDPNTFSATLLHAMPLLVPFWLAVRGPKVKPLIVGHLLLNLLCIYLTGSRRAYVGMACLTFLLVWRSKNRWSLLMMLGLLSPLVFAVMREDLQTRLLTIFDSSVGPSNAKTSARFRLDALFYGLDIMQNYPLTGSGPATFALASRTGLQAHNLYAQVMSEMGLLGIIALTALVYCFWRNSREMERLYAAHPWWEKGFVYHVGRCSWLAVILLLFMGVGGHNMFRYNWLWFAAFQICAMDITRRRARAEAVAEWSCAPAPPCLSPLAA
jgi:hypothetical protein